MSTRALLSALLFAGAAISIAAADEPPVTFGRRAAQVGDVRSETLVIESRSSSGAQIASWTLVRRVKVLAATPQGGITDARVDCLRSSVWVNFCMFGFRPSDLKGSFRFTRDVDTFRVRRVGAPRGDDGLSTFGRLVLSRHARELQAGAAARFVQALPVGAPLPIGRRIDCANPVGPRLLDRGERVDRTRDRVMFHPFLLTFDRQTMTLRRTERFKRVRCGRFDVTLATPVGPTADGLREGAAALRGTAWIEVATGRLRRLRADGPGRIKKPEDKAFARVGTIHLRLDIDYAPKIRRVHQGAAAPQGR